MKKLLITLVLLIVLVPVIAIVALTQLVDPNSFKPMITEQANNTTGGKLVINGDLGWSFFPSVGFTVADLAFTAPADPSTPMATLQSAQLKLALTPLLQGKIKIGGINVEGAKLNLKIDKNGRANWEFDAPGEQTTSTPSSAETPSGPGGELAFNAKTVAFRNIMVNFSDARDGTTVAFGPLNASGENISLANKPFPFHIDFKTDLNNGELSLALDSDMTLSLSQSNNVEITQSDTTLKVKGKATSHKVVDIRLVANGSLKNHNQANLNIEQLAIANMKASGKLSATDTDGKPLIKGNLNIPTFNLKQLMENTGMEAPVTADPEALTAISLKGDINGPANSLIFRNLQLTIDGATLAGTAGISNLDTNTIVANLKGKKLDLDRLLPPTETAKNTGNTPSTANKTRSTASGEDTELPIDTLRSLNFSSHLQIQELIANGLTLHAFNLEAEGKNRVIHLKDASLKLYNGSASAQATLDMRSNQPKLSVNKQLTGLELKPLLTDLSETDWIAGNADFNVALKASGSSVNQIKSTLSGPVKFKVRNLVAEGINMEQYVCQAVATARKKQLGGEWPDKTSFKAISGQLQFNSGVATSDNIMGGLSNMILRSNLWINVPEEQFDARLKMRITGDLKNDDSACAINRKYRSIDWPVRCKGAFTDEPGDMCGLDSSAMGDVLEQLAKAEAKEAINKKLDDELGEDWKAIKGLLFK